MFTGVSRMASIFSSLNCFALPFGSDFAYASRWLCASSCMFRRVSAERMTTKSHGCECPTDGAVCAASRTRSSTSCGIGSLRKPLRMSRRSRITFSTASRSASS